MPDGIPECCHQYKAIGPHSQHPRGAGCGVALLLDVKQCLYPVWALANGPWECRWCHHAQLLQCLSWGFASSPALAWYSIWLALNILLKFEHILCFLVFLWPCFAFPTHLHPSGKPQLLLLTALFHGLFPHHCQEEECGLIADTDHLCFLVEWSIFRGNWTSTLTFLFIFILFFHLPNFLVAESTVAGLSGFKSYLHYFTSCVKLDKLTSLCLNFLV